MKTCSRESERIPETRCTVCGSTLIEVLVAGTLLALTLLGVCGMFVSGYADVASAGQVTMSVTGSRHILEDMRALPYDSLINLNGFSTDDSTTLPSVDPEREAARSWRYAIAGEGVGWSFTDAEKARWSAFASQGTPLDGTAEIDVIPQSPTLSLVTVRITAPGGRRTVELSTLIARL